MDHNTTATAVGLPAPVARTAFTVLIVIKGRKPFLLDVRVELTGEFPSFVIRLITGRMGFRITSLVSV